MSTALIVNAIRNMFRQSKPSTPKYLPPARITGGLGQLTRIAVSEYQAGPDMPELSAGNFWKVTPYGRGSFRVGLYEHAPGEPRLKTSICGLMEELSPQTIIQMARTITRATGSR